MPPAVLTTAVLAIATLPLASALRPPQALAVRDPRVCIVIGAAGCFGLVIALGCAFLGLFWPGIFAFGSGLAALHLMFLCSGEPHRGLGSDDDDMGGGGGGWDPPEDPRPPRPGGLSIDWSAFDRERARWAAGHREPTLHR